MKLVTSYFHKDEGVGENITFVIVDDEFIIRSAVKRVIIRYYNELNLKAELCLIEACDGIECLLAMYLANSQNIRINAIISDETMPFMYGTESSIILKQLVNKEKVSNVPMYLSTAVSHTNIQDYASDLIKKIYSKPLDKSCIKEIFNDLNLPGAC